MAKLKKEAIPTPTEGQLGDNLSVIDPIELQGEEKSKETTLEGEVTPNPDGNGNGETLNPNDLNPEEGNGGEGDKEENGQEDAIPPHIEKILKLYPQYESLYIDNRGGVFTVETNQNIRKEAILYKNKNYKQ